MEYRSPVHTADGRIDCEINHPLYGWIAFTADANDVSGTGAELHAEITVAGGIADPLPQVVPVPDWPAIINVERDRRIVAGFMFQGKPYDLDAASKDRILGAFSLALAAIGQGAQPNDPYWSGDAAPFVWIAGDNTLTQMDAPTVLAFGTAAARHESTHIFAGRAIKESAPIPADITDDALWPAVG